MPQSNSEIRKSKLDRESGDKLERWRLPGAAGVFELGGDGNKELFFVRAGDELDADGEAFGGAAHGKR